MTAIRKIKELLAYEKELDTARSVIERVMQTEYGDGKEASISVKDLLDLLDREGYETMVSLESMAEGKPVLYDTLYQKPPFLDSDDIPF